MNSNTIRFHPHIQKLKPSHKKTLLITLEVKGLNINLRAIQTNKGKTEIYM